MKKNLQLLLTLLCCTILLPGCWKTIGKVDMSKVITIDELNAKKHELVGKVITLQIDTIYAFSYGRTYFFRDLTLQSVNFSTSVYQNDIHYKVRLDSLRKLSDPCTDIWDGSTHIQLLLDYTKSKNAFPWISFNKRTPDLSNESLFRNTIQYSPSRFISGILVGGLSSCNGEDTLVKNGQGGWAETIYFPDSIKSFRWCTPTTIFSCAHQYYLIPLGIKYKPGHLELKSHIINCTE
ncbi:MAG: hypothetical protein GX639_15050 [Fibrobacter sp.]|nr:hypothetical protein [Fibrobacter sp.]